MIGFFEVHTEVPLGTRMINQAGDESFVDIHMPKGSFIALDVQDGYYWAVTPNGMTRLAKCVENGSIPFPSTAVIWRRVVDK